MIPIALGLGLALAGALPAWDRFGPPARRAPAFTFVEEGPSRSDPVESPLRVRLSPVDAAEQAARLRQTSPFEQQPWLLTPGLLRNPLVGDEVAVEIENASGGVFEIYGSKPEHAFWIGVPVEDADGRPASFRSERASASNSLKRLGPIAGRDPVIRIEPGEVLRLRASLCDADYLGDPLPGTYTARVRCRYYRAPDGEDRFVESPPVLIRVTGSDARGWRRLRASLFETPEYLIAVRQALHWIWRSRSSVY